MKIDLYQLLPAIYRNRDAVLGEPLRALMTVLGDELHVIRQDIERLYDNWFIETCDEWVVPYIGDLLGVDGMHPGRPEVFSLRPFVANTLAYRRRKGTASVLENIAQDVSGWSASVVEFFQLITTAQNTNHVRLTTIWNTDENEDDRVGSVGTLDLRKGPLVASLGTAFDTASRTLDIREFTQTEGWHNINRLGIFIWRLRSYPMREAVPHMYQQFTSDDPSNPYYACTFFIHSCPVDFPLFVDLERRVGATQRVREWEVPQPIGHDAFVADMERYYGDEKSLLVSVAGTLIDISCIGALDMSDWHEWDILTWTPPAAPAGCKGNLRAYIDVVRGRLLVVGNEAFDPGVVRVAYNYGFSANIGGGPYGRSVTTAADGDTLILVSKATACSTLSDALSAPLAGSGRRIIRIMDNGIYDEGVLIHTMMDSEEIIIEAADGMRPTVKGFIYFQTPPSAQTPPPPEMCQTQTLQDEGNARLTLSGLLFQAFTMFEGKLDVTIEHCTMLPDTDYGDTSVYVTTLNYHMTINIARSVLGPLGIDAGIRHLRIADCVIDGDIAFGGSGLERDAICGDIAGMPGPETSIERTTIFGNVFVRALPVASDSIFMGDVQVMHRQDGCMRYCYVDASFDNFELEDRAALCRTPRRFRCQPDLALAEVDDFRTTTDPGELERIRAERERIRKKVQPLFHSQVYGQPEYARLSSICPEEIRQGAESGSEMGVFNELMEPQREANLREGVRRYLPFGLEMNILYADEETKS